jgi:hypothetical protein
MTTIEENLSLKGDCIVAVAAGKGIRDLKEELREAAKSSSAVIKLTLNVGGESVEVTGRGDPSLTFENPRDIVTRTSGYTCGRTLMVHADKAAKDLPRAFTRRLADNVEIHVTVTVETPDEHAPVTFFNSKDTSQAFPQL